MDKGRELKKVDCALAGLFARSERKEMPIPTISRQDFVLCFVFRSVERTVRDEWQLGMRIEEAISMA